MQRASLAGALVLVGLLATACSSPPPGPGLVAATTTTTSSAAATAPTTPTTSPSGQPAEGLIACQAGPVTVVLQPGTNPQPVCLQIGGTLLVSLAAEPAPGDDVWSGPPAVAGSSVLQTTSTAAVDGLVTTRLVAVAVGQTTVVAEANAACNVQATNSPPCSLPVTTSTLTVWVDSP